MINIDKLTTDMLLTLFPDVASPGFSLGAVLAGLVALASFALFVVAMAHKWNTAWAVFYLYVAIIIGAVCLILHASHRDVWRNVTLPGALSRDPEAAVVVQRVRSDIEWINGRAATRAREKPDGK